MIKLKTVGMIDKNLKNDPTVKTSDEIHNGYLCEVIDGLTIAPIAGTSGAAQTKDIRIVLNSILGDEQYQDTKIAKGAFANTFMLKEWDGQCLVFDESHITYASDKKYADINVGDNLIADTYGKFAVTTDVTNYEIYFKVIKKVEFNGNGIEARIVVA